MKKILGLCAALLCAYQITNAQTQKGNQNLSLYLQYQNTSSTAILPGLPTDYTQTSKSNSFNIGPSYGYFVADGLELGGVVSYMNITNEISDNGASPYSSKSITHGLNAGLYLKKYVLYENKVGFRTGPFVNYSYGKSDISGNNVSPNNNKSNAFGAGGQLDLVFYPSPKWGLAANLLSLSYNHSKTEGTYPATTNQFNFSCINSGLSLSVFWVLK